MRLLKQKLKFRKLATFGLSPRSTNLWFCHFEMEMIFESLVFGFEFEMMFAMKPVGTRVR